jgi:Protein of unknown function (DUF3892)
MMSVHIILSVDSARRVASSKQKEAQLARYIVTQVRKELSADGTHRHIEGVCLESGTHYTRQEVVDSIRAGNTWKTKADGYEATISVMSYCPRPACLAKPYIKTNPDSTNKDNLENLDPC